MKSGLIITLFMSWLFGEPGPLKQASRSFDEANFVKAVELFQAAKDEYPDKIPAIEYNMGQAWLQNDSAQKALESFRRSVTEEDGELTSMAMNNIGAILGEPVLEKAQASEAQGQALQPEVAAASLEALKESLRKNPENEEARYNYEMLKKLLEMQQDQQQDQKEDQQQENQDQNQDQENQEQKQDENSEEEQNSEQQDQSSSQQDNQKRKPQEGKGENAEYKEISLDQARMLLEGMKENEKQFLQELRKSSKKIPENNGYDW